MKFINLGEQNTNFLNKNILKQTSVTLSIIMLNEVEVRFEDEIFKNKSIKILISIKVRAKQR